MIGLLLRAVAGPAVLLCGALLCCCARKKCKIRDICCVKWLFRTFGTDPFDDFELIIHVHEATFESKKTPKTKMRFTAGDHVITTAQSKKSFFQEVLSITVEQGSTHLVCELLGENGGVIANLKLHVMKDLINHFNGDIPTSRSYHMNQKDKHVINPSVTLTLCPVDCLPDEETGIALADSGDMETTFLMRRHLQTAEEEIAREGGAKGELEIFMQACEGPIELFTGFGTTKTRFLTITGPPQSRRYTISFWASEAAANNESKSAEKEIDVTKVQGVQMDPGRNDVFVLSYKSLSASKTLTCRATDRPTKIWVETITLLVTKIHDAHAEYKRTRKGDMAGAASKGAPKIGAMKSKASASNARGTARVMSAASTSRR